MVPTPTTADRGAQDRARQEHLPRLQAGPARAPTAATTTARTSSSRATRAAPAAPAYITRINLDADARAPRDAAGHDRTPTATRSPTIDGSTWDPFAQRLLFTTENADAPTYAATPDFPSTVTTSPARSAAAATRASRTTPTATSGSSRTSAARTSRARRPRMPEQLRLPLRAARPGRPGQRQAAGAPGAQRRRRADHVREPGAAQQPRPGGPAHATARRSRPAGSRSTTPRTTATRRSTPTPLARGGQGDAVQAPGERRLPARARSFREFFFDETGDTNADQRRRTRTPAAGARLFKLDPARPERRHRHADALLQGRPGARRLRQRHVPLARQRSRSSRTRATRCTGSATRSTPASCSTSRATTPTRATSRSAGSPRAATRRRRSTPPTPASARTTATTRSPASTSPTATRAPEASSGAQAPQPGRRRLALVLHPAARRQPDLRGPARRSAERRGSRARRLIAPAAHGRRRHGGAPHRPRGLPRK